MKILAALLLLAQQQFPLLRVQSRGQARLPEAAVVLLSNLKTGETVQPSSFESACNSIVNSGLFAGCRFSYKPLELNGKSGYDLEFQVEDQPQLVDVVLDLPGFEAAELWPALEAFSPLIQRRTPPNEAATQRFLREIEAYLTTKGKSLKLGTEMIGGLDGRKPAMLVLPLNPPIVTAMEFTGSKAISAEALSSVVKIATANLPFTQTQMRDILRRNVTPLYEELGYLAVTYPTLAPSADSGPATIRVQVVEGQPYQLANVRITGEGVQSTTLLRLANFPVGKLANWKQVEESLSKISDSYSREGYLRANVTPQRKLLAGQLVDLDVAIDRGIVYYFRSLELKGLDRRQELIVRDRWKLKPGDPFDGVYAEEFPSKTFRDPRFDNIKQIAREMTLSGPNSDQVTLTIKLN